MTARQILRKADQKRRVKGRGYSSTLIKFDARKGLFEFSTSGEELYTQLVQITPVKWRLVKKEYSGLSMHEAFEKLQEDSDKLDILVDCSCPDFTYGGFAYIATKLGFGIRKEFRAPVERNRALRGSVCKHLVSVLELIV